MIHEALEHANKQVYPFGHLDIFTKALSATEQDVDKFLDGVRADAVAEYLRQAQATMCAKVVR
jgi:hypothetical protein